MQMHQETVRNQAKEISLRYFGLKPPQESYWTGIEKIMLRHRGMKRNWLKIHIKKIWLSALVVRFNILSSLDLDDEDDYIEVVAFQSNLHDECMEWNRKAQSLIREVQQLLNKSN
jgi:hypothetical protein